MRWTGLADFLALDGYGVYVWSAFGVTALCMVWEVFMLLRRRDATGKWMRQDRMTNREAP